MEARHRTSVPSEYVIRRGAGFPSANRELARQKPNYNDPNGYYAYLDLPTTASIPEIKKRCRYLLKMHHPDGVYPRRDLFERVEEIYTVLTDPVKKATYDHTPEGSQYVDSVVLAELKAKAGMTGMALESLLEDASPKNWAYIRQGERQGDDDLAARWYHLLLKRAAYVGYTGRIVLVLHDDYQDTNPVEGEEFMVARSTPSTAQMAAMLLP